MFLALSKTEKADSRKSGAAEDVALSGDADEDGGARFLGDFFGPISVAPEALCIVGKLDKAVFRSCKEDQ